MHMETLEQSLLKLPIEETLLGNARTQPFSALGVELEVARRKRFWSVYIAKPGSKNVKEECRRRSISGVQTENQEIRRRAPASDPARKILPLNHPSLNLALHRHQVIVQFSLG